MTTPQSDPLHQKSKPDLGTTPQSNKNGVVVDPIQRELANRKEESMSENTAQTDNTKKEDVELPNWPCEWEGCLNDVKYQIDLKIDDMKPWICDEHMNKLVDIFGDREDDEV